MDKEINKVYSSTDYGKFSMLETNRDLRIPHVEELKESIKNHPLEKPIDVNEKFQIIDGQHRFWAWQDLGMPIIYIIHKGWGETEVPILNTNQKNWLPSDFVKMYSEMGKEDYTKYKEFSERYGFTHHANILLLSGGSIKSKQTKLFNEGKFEVKKWMWANMIAKQILDLKPHYAGYKRSSFVSAYIQISMDNKFNHTVLMEKMQYQSRKLVDCTTVSEYYELLLEIYNYRTRTGAKVERVMV